MKADYGADRASRSGAAWGPIAGIAFAVLFVAGMFTMITPDGSTEQAINEFYADSGKRTTVLIGAYLVVLAGFAFLWFLSSLRQTVRRLAPENPELGDVLLGGGILFVAMIYAGTMAIATGAAGMTFGGEEQFSADVLRMLPQLGYGLMLVGGGFSAIAVVLATSIAVRKSSAAPAWLGVYGMVTAVLLLAAVTYVPMVFFPIWAITISIVLLRRMSRSSEAVREMSGTAAQAR